MDVDLNIYEDLFPECKYTAWSRRGASLLKSEVFADVCVRVDDSRFSCHKIVLASASEFFEKLFKNDGLQTGDVTLQQTTPKIFKIFLDYIYTWDDKPLQNLTFQELSCLLENSHMWMAVEVEKTCEKYIFCRCSSEQPKELIQLYKVAYILDKKSIMDRVIQIMKNHSMDHPEIYNLDIDCFTEYMVDLKFNYSETDRFRMAKIWIEKNVPKPDHLSDEVTRILQSIDFENMLLNDFYNGPGKSKLLADSRKVEIMYKISTKSSVTYYDSSDSD